MGSFFQRIRDICLYLFRPMFPPPKKEESRETFEEEIDGAESVNVIPLCALNTAFGVMHFLSRFKYNNVHPFSID